MYIQAVDGNFYRNPKIIEDKWLLECVDDQVLVKRALCKWETARKYLAGAGVKSRIMATHPESATILDGRLVKVSVFQISLLQPIPVPTGFDIKLKAEPSANELQGELLLKWPTKS